VGEETYVAPTRSIVQKQLPNCAKWQTDEEEGQDEQKHVLDSVLLLTDFEALSLCDTMFAASFVSRLTVLKPQQDICLESVASSNWSRNLA
jgi:hypothetical protein